MLHNTNIRILSFSSFYNHFRHKSEVETLDCIYRNRKEWFITTGLAGISRRRRKIKGYEVGNTLVTYLMLPDKSLYAYYNMTIVIIIIKII